MSDPLSQIPLPPWVGTVVTLLIALGAPVATWGALKAEVAALRSEMTDVRTDVREVRQILLQRGR